MSVSPLQTNKHEVSMFGCPMHALSMDESVALIDQRIVAGMFTQHVVVNVAKLVSMQKDEQLAESVRACDIINVDGMGVVWGGRVLGVDIPERVAGIDLFHRLLELSQSRGYPVFFLGAEDSVVSHAVSVLHGQYPALKVAGFHHGYFWEDEQSIVAKIQGSGARLLFVAITSPKKENFINKWRDCLGVDFVMGVGGTFDVVAGKVSRAPIWMQQSGLEWLHRVLQEPKRMAGRYLVTNSIFAMMLLKAKLIVKNDSKSG